MFYMEVWIKDVSGTNGHYMGSIDYNESFSSLGGNPGSFGYWVMSNSYPGTSWVKYSGYIGGFGTSTGKFVSGTKYWTPQALFNYVGGGTTYISGWKVTKVNQRSKKIIQATGLGVSDSTSYQLQIKNSTSVSTSQDLTFGADGSYGYIQSWNSKPLYINNQGNVVYFGSYAQSGSSLRAPIFYDSDDTGWYVNPNSTSNINYIRTSNVLNIGGWTESVATSSFRGIEFHSEGNRDYYIGKPAGGWTQPLNVYFYTGVRHYAHQAYDYGVSIWNISSGNIQAAFGYGGDNVYLFRTTYAPSVYDYNDTGYYVDSNSTSRMYRIDYNNLYYAGNTNYGFLGANVYADTINSGDAGDQLELCYYRGTYTTTSGSMRAPLFYDRDNTGYYVDPNGDSQFSAVYANNWFRAQGGTGLYFQDYGRGLRAPDAEGSAYGNVSTYGGGRNGWRGYAISSRMVWMSDLLDGGSTTGMHDNNVGWIWRWINESYFTVDRGYSIFNGSARAPIFYDSNDTGYYCDPNGTSRLNNTTTDENYTYGWFRNYTSAYGMYNQAVGNHWYADSSAYWNIGGTNNSYCGIRFRPEGHQSTVRGYVYADTSNNIGFLGSSGNWKLRVVGDDYSLADGSSMRAPIFYDSNDTGYYCDPNSTSASALRIRGGTLHGPNPTWGRCLYIGGNGDNDSAEAQIFTTNGNLHLESKAGYAIYLNNYRGGWFRAYGWYDSDDSGYYVDPNSTSNLNAVYTQTLYKQSKTVPAISIQDSAPSGIQNGDLWWQSSSGKLKVWYNDGNSTQWVDAVPIPDTSTFFSKAGGAITGPVVMSSSLSVVGAINAEGPFIMKTGNGSTGSINRALIIKEAGDATIDMGNYPGAWTSALQIQSNDASTYLWLSPLTSNIPRLQTNYGSFEIHPNGSGSQAAIFYSGSTRAPKIRRAHV